MAVAVAVALFRRVRILHAECDAWLLNAVRVPSNFSIIQLAAAEGVPTGRKGAMYLKYTFFRQYHSIEIINRAIVLCDMKVRLSPFLTVSWCRFVMSGDFLHMSYMLRAVT